MSETPPPGSVPASAAPPRAPDGGPAPATAENAVLARAEPGKPGGSVIRSSLVFSGLTLVSRIMGFLRDLVITARLGASATAAADAYNTALAFPNLFRRIFAEGAFAAAFVPAYARAMQEHGEAEADRIAGDAMATLAAATIGITIAAQLAMPWLMVLINPGYRDDPEKFRLAVILTQIAMPYLPCMAIVAHLSGVLNARGRFVLSAAAPTLLNLLMLVFVWPQTDAIRASYAASFGVLAAGVAQAALLTWGVRRTGAKVHWVLPRLTPEIRGLIGLAVPGAIAASATQINIFVSGVLASQQNGARSWLAVADRLYQLPLGLFGVAIGVALLPRLSRAVHAGDKADAQGAMDDALVFASALTLPAAAALIAMPFFLIDGLFTRGEFLRADALQTARALFHYGWGVPAFVLIRVLSPAFFARQDTKAPMRFALITVGVNIALGLLLFRVIGFPGIAAATSAAAWLNVTLMAVTLGRRGAWRPTGRTVNRLLRILATSGALGALLVAAERFRPQIEGLTAALALGPLGAKEWAVALTVLVAGGLYPALLFASGGVTVADLKRALRRPAGAAPVVEG